MPGNIELPLLPEEAIALGPRLAVIETREALVFLNASGPLMSCARNDETAKRYIGAVILRQGLAKVEDLAAVLGGHRSTLFRNQKLYRQGGLEALRDGRGHGAPRRAHKLTDEVLPIAQACLDQGGSQSQAARAIGVSETAIRHAIKTARLRRGPPARPRRGPSAMPFRPAVPVLRSSASRSACSPPAVSWRRPPRTSRRWKGWRARVCGLPCRRLSGKALLRSAERVYAPLKAGFYGLHSVLLCLVIMALLRIKNIARLSDHPPGELGILLGLDRVPEVKTLRRKLAELGGQQRAAQLAGALTAQWAQDKPDALGVLYVDGHVSSYTGRKHVCPVKDVWGLAFLITP